jgi:DnaJ family protein C protein 7
MKRLSNVRILQGEFGEAKMLLEKCVCLEPKIQEHLEDLKGVRMSIKSLEDIYTLKDSQSPDYEKLELSCSNMLTKCKEFSALKIIYINTLLNNCKPQVAISFLNSKLNEDEKTNEEFEYLTALALYYDGRIDNAKKFLSVYMQKSLDSQKFKKLNQLIKETESEKEKANSIFKLGNFDEAINYYTKILNLDPSNKIFNATIYNNRALCLQKKNKLLEALADVNTAIGLNANYSKAYLRRGNINMSLAYYEEAKYDFQKAKDLDPSNTDINRLLEEAKKQEKQAKRKDYYKILDLEKGANEADVRKAYRKLAIKWHPDKNSETEEQNKHAEKMFKDINEAYSVLSDPKKKQMFDNGIYPDENGYGKENFLNRIFLYLY